MTSRRTCLALTAAFALGFAPPVSAEGTPPERDRQSILAMAGDYKVRFDMRETVSFVAGYTPLTPKISGGYEAVRVIEDRGDFISLQHILVVEDDGAPAVVKHWRQDWTYQPSQVLTYKQANLWRLRALPGKARKGAWSQTVWQTDDSPRYGGVGTWTYGGGVASWQSDATLRPLARRDAVRKPVYGWYTGWNRHALTPTGWVHEQDNTKQGLKGGQPMTYVHEVVLNTYDRSTKFPIAAADRYWASTRDYWAQVRLAWDRVIDTDGGIAVTEEADNGSVTGPKLMGLADEIAEGKTDVPAAIAQAKALISGPARTRSLASTPSPATP